MDKISGIIPANPRVTTVDLKNSGTARAGAPSFGRDVGVSSITVRNMEKDLAARAAAEHKDLMNFRSPPKNDPHAEIVKNMADSFFMKRKELLEKPNQNPQSDPISNFQYDQNADVITDHAPVQIGEVDVKKIASGETQPDDFNSTAPTNLTNMSNVDAGVDEDAPVLGGTLDIRV